MNNIYEVNFIHRFDLMAKILYVKYRNINFFKQLYKNNIETFNGGWEYPGTKINVDEFIKEFDNLIESFRKSKFLEKHSIPLGTNKVIQNGAHRFAISYVYKINPIFTNIKMTGNINYNHLFFKDRKPKQESWRPKILSGMDQKYMDRMALEFCFNVKNFKIICLFPSAIGKNDRTESILKQNGHIYYRKRIKISKKAMIHLTHELYRGEKWIGGFYPTSNSKGNLCYGKDDLRIYIFIPNNKCNIVNMKKSIRDVYNIDKHSIHIHDTYEEGFRIAKTLLNSNSINFLEKSTFNLTPNNKNLLLSFYNSVNPCMDDYCIDSSFVLALYGLREAKDLDYLTIDNKTKITKNKDINNHNSWSHHYTTNKNNIILDPDLHFYYAGIKFATLDIVKKMKIKRGEDKDKRDVKLINKV